ncbi:hypothetical protein TSUD_151700 [Trifolium subterraneum]|uniref:Uncharacterized protein n=1 Tax=Trifolium subterraneum TaxID=3900 RepID=A0A2Z6P7M0_TRISU|nr:hypothetical protein TSUD_151700 [Trifolium subterraneum]
MAEYLKITKEDRWEQMITRKDAAFGKIMAKLEILLQHYNCSPRSFHCATNSLNNIPTSEPMDVNLLVQDEIHSSAISLWVVLCLLVMLLKACYWVHKAWHLLCKIIVQSQ